MYRFIITNDDPAIDETIVNTRLADDIDSANQGVVGYDNYSVGAPNTSEAE